MGSIIDYIECPNCKSENIHSEFWYKTGEEYSFCDKCGYSKKAFIKNRDKKLDELTDEDWDIAEVKNPYGIFKASSKGNPGFLLGTLETEQDLEELKSKIFGEEITTESGLIVDTFVVSRFIDGEIKEFVLIPVGITDKFNK
jgi:Zn ribbon nucleic-acid-binding protein